MSRDEDLSALQPTAVSTDRGRRLASRRWATVMLALGLVLGVLGGQFAALYRPDLLAWMVKPSDAPVIASNPAVEQGEATVAYGSGLTNPANLDSGKLSNQELRLVMRIQDLGSPAQIRHGCPQSSFYDLKISTINIHFFL